MLFSVQLVLRIPSASFSKRGNNVLLGTVAKTIKESRFHFIVPFVLLRTVLFTMVSGTCVITQPEVCFHKPAKEEVDSERNCASTRREKTGTSRGDTTALL